MEGVAPTRPQPTGGAASDARGPTGGLWWHDCLVVSALRKGAGGLLLVERVEEPHDGCGVEVPNQAVP
jgi:hypothetical protein